MKILVRYILGKFLKPFLAAFAALCILIFVSQLFDRLDRFLNDGVGIFHILGFLITSLPFQAIQMMPVACLLGTLFVVGNLSQTREYSAGLAGGIPPERFLSGLFWAGLGLSLLVFVANETFVPPTTHYARTVFREKIRRLGEWRPQVINDFFAAGVDGRLWSIKAFDAHNGTMDRVIVDTYENGLMKSQVDAKRAEWTSDSWNFFNGVIRTFRPDGISIQSIDRFKQRHIGFREKPADFSVTEPEPEEMTYKQLKKHIRRLAVLGVSVRQLEVELMMKLAFPFTCLVVSFLGVPLALKAQGSRAMGIAAAGLITLFYLGFIQFGKALAQRHVPPWLGAWLGNLVFMLIALYLWKRMKRTA